MKKNNDWLNIPKNIEDYEGFVYEIINKKNNKSYIGSKHFWRINKRKLSLKPNKSEQSRLDKYKRTYNMFKKGGPYEDKETAKIWKEKYDKYKRQLKESKKGKKKTIKSRVETDWRNYWSSSEGQLKDDIDKYGKENFIRKIIRPCRTNFEVKYYEAKEQFDRDVLFYPKKYYNGIIEIRSGRCPKKLQN